MNTLLLKFHCVGWYFTESAHVAHVLAITHATSEEPVIIVAVALMYIANSQLNLTAGLDSQVETYLLGEPHIGSRLLEAESIASFMCSQLIQERWQAIKLKSFFFGPRKIQACLLSTTLCVDI